MRPPWMDGSRGSSVLRAHVQYTLSGQTTRIGRVFRSSRTWRNPHKLIHRAMLWGAGVEKSRQQKYGLVDSQRRRDLIHFALVQSLQTGTEKRKNLQHLLAHESYSTLPRKYMFKAFYLHLSNILMCLQPCGSDMIRRSGAESNAMIWGKWGR